MITESRQYPLSPSQSWMWQRTLHFKHVGQSTENYNRVIAFRLRGNLAPELLAAALRQVIERHEPLTAQLSGTTATPTQHAGEAKDVVEVMDLRSIPADRRQQWAVTAVSELVTTAWRPFEESPTRARIVIIEPDELLVGWVAHQLAFAGASSTLWFKEVIAIYQALLAKDEATPPPAPSYFEYARHEAARMTSASTLKRVASRLEDLAGIPPLTGLPTIGPRDRLDAYQLTVHPVPADRERMCLEPTKTLFVAVMAAWVAALAHYAGNNDLCVWYMFDAQPAPEHERMMGNFLNLVPVPVRGIGRATGAELRDIVTRAYDYSYLRAGIQYQGLVEQSDPHRAPHDAVALFTSGAIVNFQDSWAPTTGASLLPFPEGEIEAVVIPRKLEAFLLKDGKDRDVWAQESPQLSFQRTQSGHIAVVIVHNSALYASEFIDALGQTFLKRFDSLEICTKARVLANQ